MKKVLLIVAIILGGFILLSQNKPEPEFYIETPPVPEYYVGKIQINEGVSVRLLILKHCPDSIADGDADDAVQAANLAATNGLNIRQIGNHRIDREGVTDRNLAWGQKFYTADGLKNFISESMKKDAEPGDTLIIYTIGHGGGDGSLMRLGQRGPIMKLMAEAAAENEQETFWWQLSCHAAAALPPISELSDKEQEYFSMIASSTASELSYFRSQGPQFQKLFMAMAEKSTKIDPNQDDIIVAKELADFLDKEIEPGRGSLFYARSPDEPIFSLDWANRIPIIGPDGRIWQPPGRGYIPHPQRNPAIYVWD